MRNRARGNRLILSLLILVVFESGLRAQNEDDGGEAAGDVVGHCPERPLSAGVMVTATLTSSDCISKQGPYYTHVYSFSGQSGQRVAVLMTSTAFDSYLALFGPDGRLVAADDDSGGGGNARIPAWGGLTLSKSGLYRVEASTFRHRQTGSYSLTFDNNVVNPTIPSGGAAGPFRFVPLSPCRLVDTRPEGGKSGAFGPPYIPGGAVRIVPVRFGGCDALTGAVAYSLNITVVPRRPLAFLVAYPGGQTRPNSSTLNSFDGRVVANSAIVQAGPDGSIQIYVTDDTDVVVDINGYLAP